MESRVHIVISALLGLMYLAFAAVQYNDPDPLLWIAIYGVMVLLMALNIWRRLPLSVSALPMIMALIGAIWLWPEEYQGLTGKMDSRPGVELARESLGLATCALGCLYVLVRSRLRRPPEM